jgi:hypothetical protein
MHPFRVIRAAEEYHWPSGTYRVPALLHVTPAVLAERVGAPLEGGTEDGLGPYTGCGLELPSGARVELTAYAGGLGWNTFELRVDAAAAGRPVAEECITQLGLPPTAVDWLSGAAI